jgi:NAD(P)-dependent dehydrogenase (short-subunit alcohol dehydrogenase family)
MPEALIWGASGGIGSATVRLLKAKGWTVYAAARDESRIPLEADWAGPFDAAQPYTFDAVAYAVGQAGGALDLVLYAAGVMAAEPLDRTQSDAWMRVLDANLNGAQRAAAASLPLLNEGGHYMVTGAYVEKITLPRFGAYAAAKAALEPLIAILAKENRRHQFTLLRLGAVDTPFWQQVPFPLPKGAAQPQAVAERILARFESGAGGTHEL